MWTSLKILKQQWKGLETFILDWGERLQGRVELQNA